MRSIADGEQLRVELTRSNGNSERLRDELTRSAEAGEQLRAELAWSQTNGQRLEKELAQDIAERDALRSELDRLTHASAGLQAELAQRFAKSLELEASLARQINRHSEMLVSTSWRITAPFRVIGSPPPKSVRYALGLLRRAWRATIPSRLRALYTRQLYAELIDASDLIDRSWYLARYPDVRAAGVDPLLHYLDYGAAEGRNPSALFDTEFYLRTNPDVQEGGANPLVHYLRHGRREGRVSAPQASSSIERASAPGVSAPQASSSIERASAHDVAALPPALERFLHTFHDPDAVPPIQALYAMLARYSDREISAADLKGLPDVQALVAEVSRLASARTATEKFAASIIVPVHNKLIYTLCCLTALLMAETRSSFEIIVADDVSTDATAEVASSIGSAVHHRRNSENLGFTRNCNSAATSARGDILVFLNNDTIPLPGWLDELLATLRADRSIGLAGSMLVGADGFLQEAGGIVWRDGSAWNFGRNQDATTSQFNYVKDVDYISGASIAVPKAVWDRLGGFDELFVPAYYEDTDLAFRLRQSGFKVVYQPRSVVVHHEGISHGTDTGGGIKAYQIENQRKFHERWRRELESFHFPNGEAPFIARDRSRDKPCVLVVDHYVPQPDRDAGSRSIFHVMEVLVEAGFNVKFWPHNLWRDPVYTATLNNMGIEVFYGPEYVNNFESWIRDNGHYIHFALLSRPYVAIDFIDSLRKYSDAKLIFYGIDIHHLRLRAKAKVQGVSSAGDEDVRKMENLERRVWLMADVVYYPSDEETIYVKAAEPNCSARTIPLFGFRTFASPEDADLPKRSDILFVAGFAHDPNEDAALWFVGEVLPIIRQREPNVRLWLVGSNPTPKVQDLALDPSVAVTGYVTDEELAAFYLKSRVAIAPMRYGAGMKGKVLEAMRFGVPIVTTPFGVQGMAELDGGLPVHSSPEPFAESVLALLSDDALWRRQRRFQSEYLRQRFSLQALRDFLLVDFGDPTRRS